MRILLSLSVCALLTAADWPRFRGDNSSGVAGDAAYPVEWSKDKNLAWSADLPGKGVSSPIVHGGKVFVTACSGYRTDRLHVLAFDAQTGEKLWERQLWATGSTICNPATSMAAPTPVADDFGVYALFATGDVAGFSPDGDLKWYRSLVGDYPLITNQVGMASSPILYEDKLIVPMDNAGDSFLAALDVRYGRNVWKVERPSEINWVTPVLRRTGDAAEVLFQSGGELVAYDPDDGERLWSYGKGASTIPSTVADGERVYLTADGVTALEVKPDAEPKELWESSRLSSRYGSPLLFGGLIYNVNPSGVLVCVDPETGEDLWRERVGGKFSASLVAAGDKIYLVNEDGATSVMKVGRDGAELVATNALEGPVLATPALAGGRIFIRSESKLFCVGE